MKKKIFRVGGEKKTKMKKIKPKEKSEWKKIAVSTILIVLAIGIYISSAGYAIHFMVDIIDCPEGYTKIKTATINKTIYAQCDPVTTTETILEGNRLVDIEHLEDEPIIVTGEPASAASWILFLVAAIITLIGTVILANIGDLFP